MTNDSTRQWTRISFMLLLWAGVVLADEATGDQASVFFLYLIPIMLATWVLSLRGGLGMAVLSTATHLWTARATWPSFTHKWVFWERGASNFVIFAIVVFSFHTFRLGRKVDRERIRQLQSALPACPGCIRLRQTDGSWKDLGTCLRELSYTPPEKRLCPECSSVRETRDYPL